MTPFYVERAIARYCPLFKGKGMEGCIKCSIAELCIEELKESGYVI